MPAKQPAIQPPRLVSIEEVRRFALSLPRVKEGTSYGTTAFRVGSRLFIRVHQSDDRVLVVRATEEHRELLISMDPKTYFLTDHYRDYPWVLVRLDQIRLEALLDLLEDAWRFAAPTKVAQAFGEHLRP